jgi:predicted  nucleic acid-binding Zn-ribbon protein
LNFKDGVDSKMIENAVQKLNSNNASINSINNNGDLLELSNSDLLSDDGERRFSLISDEDNKNNEEYANVLKRKEEELNQEKTQKQQLEAALKQLEEKLSQGNTKMEQPEVVKMQEYREMQLKLEEEKRIQDKLLKEKLQTEEEMIMVERDYKSLQEEVDEQRKLIRVLRNKYKDAVEEIKDLSAEANNEKEYLGSALMEVHKEMSLYKAVLHTAFSHDEIDRIVARSRYNPDNKVWKVPSLMFRQSKLNMPNGNQDRLGDMFLQERNLVPGSTTPKSKIYNSKWDSNKSGKKTLADFSNERNVANKSEYYIGVPEVHSKYKIVKKLVNSGSAVKLNPIKPGQELTDSSLESTIKNDAKTTTKMLFTTNAKVRSINKKPIIDLDKDPLSDLEQSRDKNALKKAKLKTKSKLFSRGKNSKKPKPQRNLKMVSYIELYEN